MKKGVVCQEEKSQDENFLRYSSHFADLKWCIGEKKFENNISAYYKEGIIDNDLIHNTQAWILAAS